jgi:RNA polymerase sigma factor (sigma-70 family)
MGLDAMSDEELWSRYCGGDDAAFAEIERRYRPQLMAYATTRLAGNVNDAEDAVQNVFLEFSGKKEEVTCASVRARLYRWIECRAIDVYRQTPQGKLARQTKNNENESNEPEGQMRRPTRKQKLESKEPETPAEAAIRAEDIAICHRAIARLSGNLKQVITRRFIQQKSLQVTAKQLRVGITTVHRREQEAMKKLKQELEEMGFGQKGDSA